MAPVKRCACIGLFVLLCSGFSFASRILLDHNPDDQRQKDAHNHKTDESPISEQGVGNGIGIGYGGGGGVGYGYGQGHGVGPGGYGYGSGSGGSSGTGIGIGQGSGGGYLSGGGQHIPGTGTGIGIGTGGRTAIPGIGVIPAVPSAGGTGTGIGVGTGGGTVIPGIGDIPAVPGSGGTGTGIGIGTGTGAVIPAVGCILGVNCPNVPACGQPGSICRQPVSGCTTCPPQTGWKTESKGETQKGSPQHVDIKIAKESGEPFPPYEDEVHEMPKEAGIPPNVSVNSTNQGHECASAVNGSHD